ncbi:MAG: energy transducer TonB [Cyclobacteriaceae bacterium]|nr:energy transducer TonB [Cyclobacteriaceae bacterium]
MKLLVGMLSFVAICQSSLAQEREPTQEQIEEEKRFEWAKRHFLDNDFIYFLSYYDSLLGKSKYTRLENYKMASESSISLSRNSPDSASFIQLADQIYSEAVKWNGKSYVQERWDSIKIKIGGEPEVFKVVDEQPQFPGGMVALYKYIGENIRYPAGARIAGIEGRVFVQFIVNKDGSIDGVNAVNELGGGCEEEAVRVMKTIPNFIPGKIDGEPVYVRMVMPISFKLGGSRKRR